MEKTEGTIEMLADLLAYRKERLEALARVFAMELPDDSIEAMIGNARENAQLEGGESPEGRLMQSLGAIGFDDVSELATRLRVEYARLFIGPRRVEAPLHESVYRSGKSRMFTHDTLNVRSFYKAFGYEVVKKNLEPDDSISTELEFLANLCGRCLGMLSSCADPAVAADLVRQLEAQRDFRSLHLLVWHERFADKVLASDRSGFYGPWARYLVDVVEEDGELLEECLSLAFSLN